MAIIYVDSLEGNDSNPGTELLPKFSPKAAELTALAGDEIALKAGRCYAPVNGFFPRLKKNNIKLRAYGLTVGASEWVDYPTLDGLTYENSGATGWTHEGDGVWSKTFANAKAKRIWFGSHNGGVLTTQRTIGTAYRRTPHTTADDLTAIKAALNSTDRWHPAGSALGWKLYVYTGSTTVNPATFYAGLAILICDGATIGAEEGIYITQCSGARANNIHVRGAHGDSGRIASMTTDTIATDDAIIQHCISSCNGTSNVWAIRVSSENNPNPRKKISNSFIKDVKADSKSSQYEQDPTTAYNNISTMDMFVITGNTENCHIWDFEAINSAHVGAAMGGQENNEPVNCSILRGYIKFDSWVTYGRGIASARMTNSVIGAITIDGQNVRSQFADGHIVGNKWINMRASIRKAVTDEWAAIECYAYDYGNTSAGEFQYEIRKPRDLLIAHNFVDRPISSPGAYPLLFTTYGSTYPVTEPNPAIDLNTVRVYNNIVVLTESRSWIGSFANGGAIYDQLIKNNIIYTGSGNAEATIRWAGATVGMNVRAGQVGNMGVDPLLGTNHAPLTGSPAIKAGIAHTPVYKGLNGLSFSSTTPTIGAYEMAPSTVVQASGASVSPTPVVPTSPVPLGQVVNQRDVILQSAAQRITYVNNRAVLLMSDATLFQETDAGATPETITLTAFKLGIRGDVVFTTEPSIPMVLSGDTVTIACADMTTDALVVKASVMYEELEYTATQTIRKISNVSTAPILTLTPSTQVFHYDKLGNVTPASITITAATKNMEGTPVFSATGATLSAGANDFQKVITPASMTVDNATIEASLVDQLDRVTIIKVREGVDTLNMLLSNEAHTVPASSTGVVSSFSGASTDVKIYQGTSDVTSSWAFSAVVTGCSVTPTSVSGTSAPTFTVTALSADVGYVDITATRSGYPSQTKRFTISKAKAGTTGIAAYVMLSAPSQTFTRADSAATFSPTSIELSATAYGGAATYAWDYWNGSSWVAISGATSATYIAYHSNFVDARTYRVRATIAGVNYYDEITLVELTGGADALNGLLTNESATLPASSTGVVSSFTGASGNFKVYKGIADVTASCTFSVVSETGCDASITTAGAYSVASMSADTATAVLRATYSGTTVDKVLTLAKARAGATGGDSTVPGPTGPTGKSYVTAYVASSDVTANSTPVPTTGVDSLPSGGVSGTWSKTVPTLTNSQYMYQSDGIYDPATNQVTWSKPYWSTLKVGTLAAITADLGAITAGSMDIGGSDATSWHVDTAGNMWAGAATFAAAPFRVSNAGAITALSGTFGGSLSAATGTLGALDIASGGYIRIGTGAHIQSTNFDALTGVGFKVDADGYATLYSGKIGGIGIYGGRIQSNNYNVTNQTGFIIRGDGTADFQNVTVRGTVYATSGTFAGSLSAATGTLGDLHIASGGGIHGGSYTSYAWPASGAGFYIGPEGFKCGTTASGRYFNADQFGDVYAPGFTIINGVTTLTGATVTNPIMTKMTVAAMSGLTSSGSAGTRTIGSRTATPSNGRSPYSYSWSLSSVDGGSSDGSMWISGGQSSATVTISAASPPPPSGDPNTTVGGVATVTVTDANGLTVTASVDVTAVFT